MIKRKPLIFMIACFMTFGMITCTTSLDRSNFLEGEFWRKQALRDIIPYWYKHIHDKKYGGFHLALSREWEPIPPRDKHPPMISRQVFGFSCAFLLSGDEKYLEVARQGVDYLLDHAWDKKYGGWFNTLTQTGEPKDETKTVACQLYTDVGLALYYFVTGDDKALSHVLHSVNIRRRNAYDKQFGGYFQALNRDLSVKDFSKGKHSHYGYTSSLLINLSMFTRDPEILSFAEELMQISMERMTDSEFGWLLGYPSAFDREWKYIPTVSNSREIISAGAQLTGALASLRLYELTGKEIYREYGLSLGKQLIRFAWDSELGGWHNHIERIFPHSFVGPRKVSWWIQCYGNLLQLHLYNITGDRQYLVHFEKISAFWNKHFIDNQFGGIFQTVSFEGSPLEVNKAMPWRTSYHEMEHNFLNSLYLKLYKNHQSVKLHFLLKDTKANSKHFVSPVEDPSVHIEAVQINGKSWEAFNPQERYVILPEGKNLKMEVTLEKNRQRK